MGSPLLLSLSTVFALVGIVLVAIAFGTSNWKEYKVKRENILPVLKKNQALQNQLNRNDIFFDRVYGFFQKCYPDQVPDGTNSYNDPFGRNCIGIKDFKLGSNDQKDIDLLSDSERLRMHLMRSYVSLYIVGLVFLGLCLIFGICGCWRRSTGLILTTGILLLFTTLFLGTSMTMWHAVDYIQRDIINSPNYYKQWDPILRANTEITYGWSYIIAWIGICCILTSAILMLYGYRVMKQEEKDDLEKKRAPYSMANYYDSKGGAAVVSPYNYQTYGYGYPGYGYPTYGQGAGANGYYGYLTYGR